MQRYLSRLTLTVLLAMTATLPLAAGDHIDDIYEMSLDENLMSPEIKNDRQADKIQEFQYDMAVAFKRTNYEVEIMRDDEVIVITIPASQLFNPNRHRPHRAGRGSAEAVLAHDQESGLLQTVAGDAQ